MSEGKQPHAHINEPEPFPSPSPLPKIVMVLHGGQRWLTWWSIAHTPPAPCSPLTHLLPLPLSSPCTAVQSGFACLALAFNV